MSHTILICDDDAHIRCILAAKLRASGYTVHEARDGEEGFTAAVAHKPHLILTDFQMPGTDGLAMSFNLAANPATTHIPIIMLTARGHSIEDDTRGKTSIRVLIDKPFSAKQVLEHVQRVLALSATSKDAPHADAA
jgi:CheY-like chemotaxis protein